MLWFDGSKLPIYFYFNCSIENCIQFRVIFFSYFSVLLLISGYRFCQGEFFFVFSFLFEQDSNIYFFSIIFRIIMNVHRTRQSSWAFIHIVMWFVSFLLIIFLLWKLLIFHLIDFMYCLYLIILFKIKDFFDSIPCSFNYSFKTTFFYYNLNWFNR